MYKSYIDNMGKIIHLSQKITDNERSTKFKIHERPRVGKC